jgi:hypothetical protein|tara:strand:- start:71 stop:394 length:324 start_codon:yes stop_codon:yes gene_type:complete
MIVDVRCDDDTTQIARIVQESEHNYAVNFLERVHSSVFNFSQNVESVSKESVSGFYDVENLEKTGLYVHTQRGYEIIDDSEDEDFTCSGSETDESEDDVSLVDEDET